LEVLTGDTIDISERVEFEFYDLVLYWDNRDNEAKQNIGRLLGVSHHVGSALCYYILTEKATVLSRTTVQHFTKEEFGSPEIQERVSEFYKSLDQNINSNQYMHDSTDVDCIRDDVLAPIGSGFSEGEYFGLEPSPDIDDLIDNENSRTGADTYDKFIGVDGVLPNSGDTTLMAKVVKKVKLDDQNKPDT